VETAGASERRKTQTRALTFGAFTITAESPGTGKEDNMSKFNWGMKACGIFLLWVTAAVALPAQTFTTIYSFCSQTNCADGDGPQAGLVQGTDGNLYGTTAYGGANNDGTVFNITTGGTLTALHSFNFTDGYFPVAGLVQGANGKFYGTTLNGGANDSCDNGIGCGTVFSITASGTLTSLYSFCSQGGNNCTDGSGPQGGLVQGTNGGFYGTTLTGGAGSCSIGCGTVFSITTSATLTTLHSFDYADGGYPSAGLVQGTDGKFFGTTPSGGANGDGTVFKITPSGTLTTLFSFDGTDGATPYAGLVQGTNGDFYGTTSGGGAHSRGTVFRITASGKLKTLHSVCRIKVCREGTYAEATLVQGTDGDFYGTAEGGAYGRGTVFKITPSGTLTTLYSFCSQIGCPDGYMPASGLVQGTNGMFYGTTLYGGANTACNGGQGCGTVFSLSVGLGPFVKTQPISGAVGAAVTILGTSLTGTTSVTFNGTAATFTEVSNSEITTTVPTGATTGTVQVVTPGGTLSSKVPFTVN
jgi:uncharacterized repeat protein (TIGR03803 family)